MRFPRSLIFWALAALFLVLQGPASAAPREAQAFTYHILAETDAPAAGETVTLAFLMKPNARWHGYWQNPGDVGAPDTIAWKLPPGLRIGPLRYPVPGRQLKSGIMNYVYEGPYAILADLTLPAGLRPGTELPVRATLTFLACTDEICVPQKAQFETVLRVAARSAPHPRRVEFDSYRRALPRPLGVQGHFSQQNGRFRIALPWPRIMPIGDAYFYPLTDGALVYSSPQRVSRSGDLLFIEGEAGRSAQSLARLEGVLATDHGGFSLSAGRSAPFQNAGESVAPGWRVATVALLGALLGGLLLNVMPCVFPILSLKALSLARAGTDEPAAHREGLAYAAGSVLACLLLGGTLIALRQRGAALGWAFQLQDPRVILLLMLLVTAIALNLAGLFELPMLPMGDRLARSGGAAGAFWTGALAGFVATPCTGPFMGAALGAALILPVAAALAIFAGLGFGLTLPFLLLAFLPALRRRLPKPGAWMVRFQRFLSIPMFLTAFGLAWILERQTGNLGLAFGLGATAVLAIALWVAARRREWIPLVPALMAMVIAAALLPSSAGPAATKPAGALDAAPFSEARLATLVGEGRPVFLYFTADWCLTCKVNERVALDRSEVAEAFAAHDVAVMAGDWTRFDPAIGRYLEKQGRAGVPLYLWFAPGKAPRTLPQLLTPSLLVNLANGKGE